MKIVTGLFAPDDAVDVVEGLLARGFAYDDLSMMSAAEQVPDYLEGDPEEGAAIGAITGAATGGALGALGAVAASTIPGFETMIVSGIISTSLGGVVGGYLGSLYGARGESQTRIDLHEELESGKILVLVKTEEERSAAAASVMKQHNGEYVESDTITAEQAAKLEADLSNARRGS